MPPHCNYHRMVLRSRGSLSFLCHKWLESQYQYGSNSINILVQPRLKEALEMYETLIRYFPDGEYREQADEIKSDIDKILENYS